jgi:hypothetical protein
MLQCHNRISFHDLTHHQHVSLSIQPCHIIRRRNTSDHFLIRPNYTATVSPLPLRLAKSQPVRNTIPSPPPLRFCHYSQVSPYLPAPWQRVVKRSPSRSINIFKYGSFSGRLLIVSYQIHIFDTEYCDFTWFAVCNIKYYAICISLLICCIFACQGSQ